MTSFRLRRQKYGFHPCFCVENGKNEKFEKILTPIQKNVVFLQPQIRWWI